MYIYEHTKVPIVFDYHHYNCQQDPMSEREARLLAASTWPLGMKPIVHYSESKALHENDSKIKPQAHSDYITKLPDLHGADADIMLECKNKEMALLRLRDGK
jgi:UV DNA damage endonuclease